VSTAGDINGDNVADLLIGAAEGEPYFPNFEDGISYVIFGAVNLGYSGAIELSSLNGTNGFKVYGERGGARDYLGVSVSTAGDVNNDYVDDIIVGGYGSVLAPLGYSSYLVEVDIIRSYIIYGHPLIKIKQNHLNIKNGETKLISNTDLFTLDGSTNSTNIIYRISNINGGRFEMVDNPGVTIITFTLNFKTISTI